MHLLRQMVICVVACLPSGALAIGGEDSHFVGNVAGVAVAALEASPVDALAPDAGALRAPQAKDGPPTPPARNVRPLRPASAWEQYHWYITAVILALLFQAALIVGLLLEHRRRRKVESELRQRMMELAHVNRRVAVGELSAAIAHELNQPLGAILNNVEAAEIILNSASPDNGELKDILADIRRDDHRATEIIRRLRNLLERKHSDFREIDLNDVVRESLTFVAMSAASRDITIHSMLEPERMYVSGDRVQLQQVIINLAMNAMDAMADTPKSRRNLVSSTALTGKSGLAEFSISDSGPGMPKERLLEVFDPFVTTKKNGMGMGLSIARTIVTAHGGRIWAENGSAGGTIFRFSLPLLRAGS